MTIDEVKRRVAFIRKNKDDDEAAHGAEDALHSDVLDAIASGSEIARDLAREAMKTKRIMFNRWSA
jgi:hypothetical protein